MAVSDCLVCDKLIGECYIHSRMDGEVVDNNSHVQSELELRAGVRSNDAAKRSCLL